MIYLCATINKQNFTQMKGLTKFFVGAVAVAVLASCGSGGGADKVATDYLTALKDKNVTKAKELGTKDTQDMLEAMSSINMLPVVEEVKDVKCTEEGNTATCTYCCSKDGKNSIKLVKEGEKWLVDEKKEGSEPTAPEETVVEPDTNATSTEAVPAEEAK